MKDRRERIDITKVQDELTRRELLRRAAVGSIVLVYGGAGFKTSVAGAARYANKNLSGDLRIIQWSHFVPAYDRWFDNVYVKRWGQANDVEVHVDHALTQLGFRTRTQLAAWIHEEGPAPRIT